jgi:creatinine amidohydrolase
MGNLPPTHTGIGWYADYPDHYAGDARAATEEKGQALVCMAVEALTGYIKAVKADQVVPALNDEFFRRVETVFSR